MKNKIKILILYTARCVGLFALCRRLTARSIRILCYHGGCRGDENQYNPTLFCTAAHLASRLDWLKTKGYSVVSLDEAAAMAHSDIGRPRLPTTITFDDGWYTTASELMPVLAARGLPSTLYLCTSHYLEGWSVPAVTVRYLLWKSSLDRVALRGFGAADGEHPIATVAQRDAAADAIVGELKRLATTRDAMHALMEQLAVAVQVPSEALNLAARRFEYMNETELHALIKQQCSIELHGHIHRYPAGKPDAFVADVTLCRETIMGMGLPQPHHYCYPSGKYDVRAAQILHGMDVHTATTCLPGLVDKADDKSSYYLPRILDGERVSMLQFQAEMSGFTDLVRTTLQRIRAFARGRSGNALPIQSAEY